MTCDHKWVTYQPMFGEAEVCCANAGCGILKKDCKEPVAEALPTQYTREYLAAGLAKQWQDAVDSLSFQPVFSGSPGTPVPVQDPSFKGKSLTDNNVALPPGSIYDWIVKNTPLPGSKL